MSIKPLTEEEKAYHKKYREEHKEDIAEYKHQYYIDHKDEIQKEHKKYREEHKEELSAYFKQYRKDNHEKKIEQGRQYYQDNKDVISEKSKIYYQNNKEKIKARKRKRSKSPASISYLPKLEKYDECRPDPNNPELLQVKCKNQNCKNGGWFNPTAQQCMSRLSAINGKARSLTSENNFYCCDECKESCPVFRKRTDKPKNPSSDRGNEQKELRELIIAERGEVCEACGRSKEEFPNLTFICHHILPVKCDPILASDKDNCIIVCNECHAKIHLLPGCTTYELASLPKIEPSTKNEEVA